MVVFETPYAWAKAAWLVVLVAYRFGAAATASTAMVARTEPNVITLCFLAGRFISARAESTTGSRPAPRCPPVHLRSRGEHWSSITRSVSPSGSPPLARRARR
ncbi:hypothetical protein SAVERM_7549 [Streptomyces avermitilis MA-4680 = NBRC 14893]|uniref:Uncharacterized protein n=1 Tax=Streptomyces avermitilis (strain ATCC 31267 / DSM 46492 / JCM 5070 / NBRC 14893 / NCIMB 12804 / NRRL 8165 / MA-4680) TaxID=227882 RepID=Q825B1_STRAW|nr:hypothetical protein SAVERM_7549 [Streptomyces avermitilis MA-4680 = NBRC 14893]BAU77674.1 hypothetical protein SAVERM_2p235 [Streptomyces avermitilis MA-4680 = NBRC 14893]